MNHRTQFANTGEGRIIIATQDGPTIVLAKDEEATVWVWRGKFYHRRQTWWRRLSRWWRRR